MKINISILLFLFSLISLSAAYISQYLFDMQPCILCLYQRIPFFLILFFSGLAIIFRNKIKLNIAMNFICGLLLLVGASIAFYHVGVEHGKFSMTEGCDIGSEKQASTVEELAEQLMGKAYVPCDKPQFVFLGLSMASWNFMFSGSIGFISLIISYRLYRANKVIEGYESQKSK